MLAFSLHKWTVRQRFCSFNELYVGIFRHVIKKINICSTWNIAL